MFLIVSGSRAVSLTAAVPRMMLQMVGPDKGAGVDRSGTSSMAPKRLLRAHVTEKGAMLLTAIRQRPCSSTRVRAGPATSVGTSGVRIVAIIMAGEVGLVFMAVMVTECAGKVMSSLRRSWFFCGSEVIWLTA